MTFMTDDEAFNRWFNDTNARRPRSYKETFLAGVEYGRKTATPQPCPVCHGRQVMELETDDGHRVGICYFCHGTGQRTS